MSVCVSESSAILQNKREQFQAISIPLSLSLYLFLFPYKLGGRERDDRKGPVLAWLRSIVPSQLRRGNRRKKQKQKRKQKLMNWLQKMVFPVRRVWLAVAARVKSRNNGGGLLKLHDDIQTCGYEDVQVMWEMLHRTESELTTNSRRKRKPRSFWKIFIWHNNNTCSSPFSIDHA